MVQAIETHYAGCRFRSRLEARWAVFFDHLGVQWEYEHQGYSLPSGPYLPDFWLKNINGRDAWFEVKGGYGETSDPRWEELVEATRRPLFVAFEMPKATSEGLRTTEPNRYDGHLVMLEWSVGPSGDAAFGDSCVWGDTSQEFCVCPACGRVGIQYGGQSGRICGSARPGHGDIPEDGPYGGHPRVLAAYTAARSARFEHGESG